MSICTEYLELAPVRASLYGFLARVYRVEVDEAFLENLKRACIPEDAEDGDFSEGIARLRAFLKKPGIDPRSDLAVDYARVFLGAGIADGRAAFPYESVYTSPEGLIMQEARDEVLSLYAAKGLGIEGENHDPEDHVAFELEFMEHLVREGAQAAEAADGALLAGSLAEQRAFLSGHLLNWLDRFCDDIDSYSSTAFYPAVASITRGFLAMDADLLEGFAAEAANGKQGDERDGA